MKYLIFILSLLLFTLFTCNQEIYIPPVDQTEWQIGEEGYFEIDTTISTIHNRLLLHMTTKGFCGNSGIDISISSEATTFFDSLITEFPFDTEINVPQNSLLSVKSKVESNPNSGIICKRLGFVTCVLEF